MRKVYSYSLLVACLLVGNIANAQTDLIISEYVEGWSTNKAIEIYNPTASSINLSGYQLVRYANGEDTPPAADQWKLVLPDEILEPYKTFVAVIDKRDPNGSGQDAPIYSSLQERADGFFCQNYNTSNTLYHNGDDAIALEKTNGTLVDLFAQWGDPAPADAKIEGSDRVDGCWTDTAPYNIGTGNGITADHTLVRKSNVSTGVTSNPILFNPLENYNMFPANTFTNLGWHKFDGAPANNIPVFDMETLYVVSPLAEEGDIALTLKATDSDADQNIEYYIVSGNFIYIGEGDDAVRHEPFSLNKATGQLIVADEEALAEATEDIYFNVVACDEYGQSEIFSFDVRITEEASGINETQFVDVSLIPNPALNYFVIKSDKIINTVQILSLTGKEFYFQSANQSRLRVNFDLPSGSYIVKTTLDGNRVGNNKLIVK